MINFAMKFLWRTNCTDTVLYDTAGFIYRLKSMSMTKIHLLTLCDSYVTSSSWLNKDQILMGENQVLWNCIFKRFIGQIYSLLNCWFSGLMLVLCMKFSLVNAVLTWAKGGLYNTNINIIFLLLKFSKLIRISWLT